MAKHRALDEKETLLLDNLISNLKDLMTKNGIVTQAKCMRYIREKTDFDFNQSTFSAMMSGKLFPTVMQLNAIADSFNTSIDFLLGKEDDDIKNISLYEICTFISRLFLSEIDFCRVEFNNFDEYTEYPVLSFHRVPESFDSKIINSFLTKIKELETVSGTISKQLYEKILNEWLLCIKEDDSLPFH